MSDAYTTSSPEGANKVAGKASERPNVILIMVDQWRGDCLSIDDHPVVHTPHIDQLALNGTRFSRAYSASPTCIPARASLYTGLKPQTHGRVGYQDLVPWDYSVTIASEFTRHGYQTQAIGKMHVFPERSQMGFQNVILHSALGIHRTTRKRGLDPNTIDDYTPWLQEQLGVSASSHDHGIDSNSTVARPWDKDERLHYSNFVATESIDFLRRRDPRKPFFLFMSFNAPHPPYDPPAWAFDQYMNRNLPDSVVGDWVNALDDYANPHLHNCFVGEIDPHQLHRAKAGYYGHMTHIDHQINRFLEMLEHYNLRQNTYICFLSDHGEMMGDHHMFRKGMPYEGSARVPMIISGPPSSGIMKNAVSNHLTEMRDVMPTLLDCADLPVPASIEGRSFLPIARGETIEWRSYLHGEHTLFGQSLQWLTDGHHKYVWFSGTGHEQFFNLDDDPKELHDLASTTEGAKHVAHWRQILITELTGREEGFTDGQALIPGQRVHACLQHLRQQAGIT